MKFFTYYEVRDSNYCLLNIKHYNSPLKNTKKIIFVDPGVMELRKQTEYTHIKKLVDLADGKIQDNEYISIDYPCDMNLNQQELFVKLSVENNIKYANKPYYICAIQSKFMDQKDFTYRAKELEPIYAHKKKIVALGNLCRIMHPTKYYDYVIKYILARAEMFYWIHIYGMALACIKEYVPLLEYKGIKVSVDSTKWTRPCNEKLKRKYMKHPNQLNLMPTHDQKGLGCTKLNRNEFFLAYMKNIQKKGIKVEY